MKSWMVLIGTAVLLAGSIGVRFVWPAHTVRGDPQIRALEEKHRALAGFAAAVTDMETKSARAQAALWPARTVEGFLGELPAGWIARPLGSDRRPGVQLQRYAFSKEATLRDFSEFQRVLKKLEERPGTRIDSVNLTLNSDGKRFSAALITATIPTHENNAP